MASVRKSTSFINYNEYYVHCTQKYVSPKCMVTEMPHPYFPKQIEIRVRVVVFNATFKNLSVISWLSYLFLEEIRVP
jgi:hypothetical protein